jgi:flagellar biosynthetic protein FliR
MRTDIAVWLLSQGGATALILARVLGLAWTAPAWGTLAPGWRLRWGLAALLTTIIVPTVAPHMEVPVGVVALAWRSWIEVMIGAALGWSAALIVAGARQAGEVVGAQAGLSAAALLDPEASTEMTPLGHLYGGIALAVFLALDGPLTLVGSLIDSYRVLPVGGPALSADMAIAAFGRIGQALALTLQAAAPVALALTLAGLTLGLLNRAAPALPLLALSLPIRWAVALVLILLGLTTLVGTLAIAWSPVGVGG